MSNEIKEILNKLKDSVNYPIIDVPTMDGTDSEPMENTVLLEPNESKIILDCITNLQQKIEQYENPDDMTLMFMWCDEKAKDKIKQLQEENERLKEIEKEHKNCTRKHWQQKCAEHYANEMIYKSRNEKAIEILEQDKASASFNTAERIALNILQGSDKDD